MSHQSREEAMNKPVPVNPPKLRSTFVAASSMPWQRTDFDGIEMKILYQDDEGRSTILFKMAPGAVVPLHEHAALEQTFMLEGSLEDAEGSVGAGDFVWRAGGATSTSHMLPMEQRSSPYSTVRTAFSMERNSSLPAKDACNA
jgi:anti-sigma factor ChrR (cupin superfamily)